MNQTRYLRAPDRASSPGLNIRHRNHKVTGVAITAQQIIDHALPTKPVKATQSRKRYDIDQTVEAEAMRPDTLRRIVADAFEPMVDQRKMAQLRQIEAAERHDLRERLAVLAE